MHNTYMTVDEIITHTGSRTTTDLVGACTQNNNSINVLGLGPIDSNKINSCECYYSEHYKSMLLVRMSGLFGHGYYRNTDINTHRIQ